MFANVFLSLECLKIDGMEKRGNSILRIRNWRTLLHMHRADASCALTGWQYFSARNDVMAAIFKV